MKNRTNEQLCTLAQKEDARARSLLVEQNAGVLRKTAGELYRSMNLAQSDLCVDCEDLVQEGSIGLSSAAAGFDAARPYWKPRAKGAMPLWTPRLSVQWLSILFPHNGCSPARTGKTGTEICPDSGQISVPVFVQRRLGKAYAEALQNPRSWLEIFVLECENRLSHPPASGIIK